MSAVGTKLTETFGSLDPIRIETLETTCSDTLATNFPEKPPEVDANGWPIGYWESFAGCLDEDDDWQPSDDPPPEPHPY